MRVRKKILQSYFFRPLLNLQLPAKLHDMLEQIAYPSGSNTNEHVQKLFQYLEKFI